MLFIRRRRQGASSPIRLGATGELRPAPRRGSGVDPCRGSRARESLPPLQNQHNLIRCRYFPQADWQSIFSHCMMYPTSASHASRAHTARFDLSLLVSDSRSCLARLSEADVGLTQQSCRRFARVSAAAGRLHRVFYASEAAQSIHSQFQILCTSNRCDRLYLPVVQAEPCTRLIFFPGCPPLTLDITGTGTRRRWAARKSLVPLLPNPHGAPWRIRCRRPERRSSKSPMRLSNCWDWEAV